jgi:hypothetical protein
VVKTRVASPNDETEEMRMRTVLKATLLSAVIGLAGTSGISAAPVNGVVIKDAAVTNDPVHQVQHWRWGSGGHWRWQRKLALVPGEWHWGSRW